MTVSNRHIGADADIVGKIRFVHVDPSSGKLTDWTFELSADEADWEV